MGTLTKPQLVAVPLLFLVIGSCTAAHPWRRALVRDDAVSWNAAAASTNIHNAPRATVAGVSEPLVYSARGAAGSHATPSRSQHAAASRVGNAASHAAPHAVHYAATPHGAPHAARNAVNHGSHGPVNVKLHAASNRRGGGSRHDGNGGAIAVNGAFRAASTNDVAIHHRSSHERRTRDDRSGRPVGRQYQSSSGGAYNVARHTRNGGGNSNAQGANHLGSYHHDGVNHGIKMASAHTNAAADYEGILEEHNKARQEVGVPDLAWDDGVAATAQEWANELASIGCPLEHGGAEGLGQNLYWLSPAGLIPQEDRGAVQSWVDEKADWTPSPIPDGCADGKMCGHYTQVVWRDTTHVGCASAQCPDGSGMWVCDYSPPGNFVGQTPF
ncbi:unnamed protein product [Closterium sp. Naga37s-1]|nr:unnamed protein product [Closterium sp. Naga37s-1]